MRKYANRFLWGGLALLVLSAGSCLFGFSAALDPELSGSTEDFATVGGLTLLGSLLCLGIGAFIKVFTSED